MSDVKVWGVSEDGKRALGIVPDVYGEPHIVAVFPFDGEAVNVQGGRWECSPAHLEAFAGVYLKRFPVPAPGHRV